MQLMINAHKEPNDENQEDKEHDKEFKEVYKGVAKRGEFSSGSRKKAEVVQRHESMTSVFIRIVSNVLNKLLPWIS